jgi:uroporphyrin-III C-methyltransferase
MSWQAEVLGRPVVVVDPGSESLGTVATLLDEGAVVTLVGAELPAALADLAARGAVTWQRPGAGSEPADAWLVLRPTRATGMPVSPVPADPAPAGGRVTLVGGGPGDPGLLTIRGRAALDEADVVVVDRLAPLGHLDRLQAHVEVVDVSKIPRGRFTPQEQINALLVTRARAGRRVVRLKGGDGFVFGRGMEEVLACRAADVPVEVVPGVTSATSVPALAGIPVTHRGMAQGFTVVSGHVPPSSKDNQVDWRALVRTGTTIVVLMGVATIQAIAVELADAGLAAATPVAFVVDGGLAGQRRLDSTLGGVAGLGAPVEVRPPAVIVIGRVAALGRTSHAER